MAVEGRHSVDDLLINLIGRRCLKRRLPRDELANEHSKRPDVNAVVVPVADKDLRSYVDDCSALSVRLADVFKPLGETEIDEFQMTFAFVALD